MTQESFSVENVSKEECHYPPISSEVVLKKVEYSKLLNNNKDLAHCLKAFVEQEVEYMTKNNLGDPEKQHNVIRAREILAGQ